MKKKNHMKSSGVNNEEQIKISKYSEEKALRSRDKIEKDALEV